MPASAHHDRVQRAHRPKFNFKSFARCREAVDWVTFPQSLWGMKSCRRLTRDKSTRRSQTANHSTLALRTIFRPCLALVNIQHFALKCSHFMFRIFFLPPHAFQPHPSSIIALTREQSLNNNFPFHPPSGCRRKWIEKSNSRSFANQFIARLDCAGSKVLGIFLSIPIDSPRVKNYFYHFCVDWLSRDSDEALEGAADRINQARFTGAQGQAKLLRASFNC